MSGPDIANSNVGEHDRTPPRRSASTPTVPTSIPCPRQYSTKSLFHKRQTSSLSPHQTTPVPRISGVFLDEPQGGPNTWCLRQNGLSQNGSSFWLLLLISHVFTTFAPTGRGVDWAAQDVAQLRQWLEEGRKPREMRAVRSDWLLESIKTKIKQLRRGAADQSRPLKRRRTSEVSAEIETAVTETARQTLSVLHVHSSLNMSRQVRCFKPVRAPNVPCVTPYQTRNY